MKKIVYFLFFGIMIFSATGCKKWLDVNRNPNGPDQVAANLYLAPMMHGLVVGEQNDGRYVGKYIQNWSSTEDKDTWDVMGYAKPPSDLGGEMWRVTYFVLAQNLIDMIRIAEEEQRWDILGVGYILKAIGFQKSTQMNGEIIVKQAFEKGRVSFDYDSQEAVYLEVDRLLDLAIKNLERTDGLVSSTYLGKGDVVYKGSRERWLKFAYGLRAVTLSHFSNKPALYKPDLIIEYIDKSFASSADDALFPFEGGLSSLANFWGQMRGNMNAFRQTKFLVGLLDGTEFGGVVDPRLSRMLQASPSGIYKGLEPTYAATTINPAADRPNSFFGTVGNPTVTSSGRYLFDDKAKIPLMTYSQLQFVKAEAAFRKGDKPMALDAYQKAIAAHLNFVNAANSSAANVTATQIAPTEMTAFLSNPNIVPTANNLTLSHIMSQKYIAQFAWAFLETWTDLRRYHYTDLDPNDATKQVFRGFQTPELARLFADNAGKVVYRVRPRYASEYVWNRDALSKIGGLDMDFHTSMPWIFKP